jgi:hypothetical protein
MSRALLIIRTDDDRRKACEWIRAAPDGASILFKRNKRTLPQNDRFWAMLTDVAEQAEHFGRKYQPDIWKLIFMAALGREVQFVPSLDGTTVVPLGYHSSDLDKDEMTELMDFIDAWGAEHGVTFHDPMTGIGKSEAAA